MHGKTAIQDIAVIGTGISGMSAAWLLSQYHRVTVYERDRRVGGHSNTVTVQDAKGEIAVDGLERRGHKRGAGFFLGLGDRVEIDLESRHRNFQVERRQDFGM